MIAFTRYFILSCLLAAFAASEAQGLTHFDTLTIPAGYKPEFSRERRHDLIDAEQKLILASDGLPDDQFAPSDKEEINQLLTRSLVRKTDWLQYRIEKDTVLDHRLKVFYLSGLENLLKYFRQNWRQPGDRHINPANLSLIIDSYEACMQAERNGETIENIIYNLPYDAGTNVISAYIFEKNPGYQPARNRLVLKLCNLHPDRIFPILQQYPDVPFADSMVRAIAKKFPRQLYDYAAAANKLGTIIRNINDDIFIKTIATMAQSRSGQQYFPFLDNIVNGRMTLRDIDAAKDDSLLYYKLLVKTQMDYVARAINKDTAFEFRALTQKLEDKARADFVNVINGLHTERNPEIRFRCIQPLNAQELYYLAVLSDGSIYTSSFVKGVYPLMMSRIENRGDSLLMLLNFDKYRKFIKMAAGFNTLDHFLASFTPSGNPEDEDPANTLMRAFVNRLEQSDGLEDGVDVADSYASISETLKPVADRMLLNIQDNYERNLANGNKKGIAIYNILGKLFLSADSTQNIDLTRELGIPPVYEVPFSALTYDSGRVAVQLFIYGDKDGIGVFPGLLSMFNNSNWKIDQGNKQWVTISSTKGKPVSLYMNRPLPEETNEDAKAQEALCQYLEQNRITPTVTINRGHSYNAPYTIEQMSAASKIVFMGSCGGYRMIHDILQKAPDAHIIGTKQIADAPVNNPFLRLIMEKLRTGNDIKWIPFWEELGHIVTDKIFEDYVPPHKNLGALFIKAYTRAMGPEAAGQ
ncbi:MAG: hypothetical protein HZA79_01060 [Sphingobacteriales bacterium]|nr:hypothetical protein [Sphingobacteriales bacterium]